MSERPTELTLRVVAPATATAGLPLFVEVTLANDTEASDYYGLMPCDPWSPPFPVEFTFSGEGGDVRLPARSGASTGATRAGFDLSPADARTFVLDLSLLRTEVPPGVWRLAARWVMRHEQPRSPDVTITVNDADAPDQPLLQRSWAELVLDRNAVEDEALRRLSEPARRALLPYLILHEAVHGPQPLSQFSSDVLSSAYLPPTWASEAGVLTYELLSARAAPDVAARRAALLVRWPGVAFRLEEIDRGAGLLTRWREEYR